MANTINALTLKGAFILGAKRLDEKKEYINELNVFPVPDGDTGINMSMTVASALNDIEGNDYTDAVVLAKAISQGSLKGARGNSGVILSQLFRGFYKVIKTSEEINVKVLSEALGKATETAYRAVMKPKEGTILTVAKAISEKAASLSDTTEDIGEFYDGLVEAAEEMLLKTPEMLPVLKQAGVVDSGGAGLLEIIKGAADFVNGRDTDIKTHSVKKKHDPKKVVLSYELSMDVYLSLDSDSKAKADYEVYLESIGKLNSYNYKDRIISVKLSTNEPGKAITKAIKYGSIDNVTIVNNIKPEKKENKPAPVKEVPTELKEMGFVSVASGKGLTEIFTGLGVDYCIKGGQTMNPSTEDILEAIDKVNAKTVFVLPNNKNILLASEQAAGLCAEKQVIVIPSFTVPQGISALISFTNDLSPEENKAAMTEGISLIKSGEVTYAVRDTIIGDKKIKKGDFMGIGDEGIISVEKNINKCVDSMLKELIDEESALISIYYGSDVTEEDANKLVKKISKKYPDLEVDLQFGGQPVYYYLLSVE